VQNVCLGGGEMSRPAALVVAVTGVMLTTVIGLSAPGIEFVFAFQVLFPAVHAPSSSWSVLSLTPRHPHSHIRGPRGGDMLTCALLLLEASRRWVACA
jgi:hypothetical protein